MRNNVDALMKLQENLDAAKLEMEQVNKEEELLGWEQTDYPQLQMMVKAKEPYEKLWNTTYLFHRKQDEWLNGNFLCSSISKIHFIFKFRSIQTTQC